MLNIFLNKLKAHSNTWIFQEYSLRPDSPVYSPEVTVWCDWLSPAVFFFLISRKVRVRRSCTMNFSMFSNLTITAYYKLNNPPSSHGRIILIRRYSIIIKTLLSENSARAHNVSHLFQPYQHGPYLHISWSYKKNVLQSEYITDMVFCPYPWSDIARLRTWNS